MTPSPLLLLLALAAATPAATSPTPPPPAGAVSPVEAHALRLHPGDDLKQALVAYARAKHLRAGFVATCVGSLRETRLRFADQHDATAIAGKMEIVSLVGTVAEGSAHLHLSVADGQGRAFGGHLVDGCIVYTTAEIVLGELPALRFERRPDPVTTYSELTIEPR